MSSVQRRKTTLIQNGLEMVISFNICAYLRNWIKKGKRWIRLNFLFLHCQKLNFHEDWKIEI